MELDSTLEYIGGFGRFQILIFVLMGLVQFQECGYLLGIVFIGEEFDHHCRSSVDLAINRTVEHGVNNTAWYNTSQCSVYVTNVSMANETLPCNNGWTYEKDAYAETVVSEWDLVCDKDYIVDLSSSIFVAGLMAGSLLVSPLSDKFGRKRVLLTSLLLRTVLAFSLAFTQDYIQFIVLRFFIGALHRGNCIISYIIITEMLPPKHRTKPGIALQFFWAAGLMGLASVAYLLPNWRHFEMAISLPTILMVCYYWLVPESPRWLISQMRLKEAEDILKKAAKMNKVALPSGMFDNHMNGISDALISVKHVEQSTNCTSRKNPEYTDEDVPLEHFDKHQTDASGTQSVQDSFYENDIDKKDIIQNGGSDLHKDKQNNAQNGKCLRSLSQASFLYSIFRSKTMLKYTLVLYYLWTVNSLAYYGISLSTSTLAGNKYLNFFISGAVEIPAYLIVMFVLDRFGRCKPMCAFQVLSGVANVITVFIPNTTNSGGDLSWLITTLAMIGKFGITGSFCSLLLYTAEIYPTSIRNTAYGIASFWDTLGGMAAPFILYKAKLIPQLPRTLFGIAAIVAGMLMLLMPETGNKAMPESVEEVEQWDRSKFDTCCLKKKQEDQEK